MLQDQMACLHPAWKSALTSIFTWLFNRSLELCEVPSCFKCSTIIPIPKKASTTELNDYRPVALTSVVMKSFEKLVLSHLKNITGPLLDSRGPVCLLGKKFSDDVVNMGLHYILGHLNSLGNLFEFENMFCDLDQLELRVSFISNPFMNVDISCIAEQLSATFSLDAG